MFVIGIIITSRPAFVSMMGSGLRSLGLRLLGEDMIIFLTSAIVAGPIATEKLTVPVCLR